MRNGAWLIIGILSMVPLGLEAAERQAPATDAKAETDWAAMIAKLREQVDYLPANQDTRHQLAIAYNNYGVMLADQNSFSESIRQLQEAARLEPDDAQFQTNLALIHLRAAQAAYQNQRVAEAKTLVAEAIKIAPQQADAYALLGEIEYHSQRLKEAKAAWDQAVKLNPGLDVVQDKLKRLNQELPVESEFEKVSQAYFDVRYTEMLKRSAGYDIRDALLRARREVGSDFALWPTRKLIVLVYSAEQFRQLRQDTPDWVAGQYDGKIRVPLPGLEFDEKAVVRTLFHEYTHALINEIADNHCPTWLNEGLAEYEGWRDQTPPWTSLRKAVVTNALVPWDQLSERFSASLPAADVALGYEEAHSVARYLVERYGFWRMRRILKAVADGADLNETLVKEFHVKLPRLQSLWREWLNEQLAR